MAKFLVVLSAVIACAFGAPQVRINDNFNWRVVGGSDAKGGQFPYQISLRSGGSHICGGSIISNRWVVTAAHCVDGASAARLSVVVGTITLNSGGTKYDLESIIVHKEWNPSKIVNDIALLKTKEIIALGNNVAVIPIGKENVGVADVVLSGWGRTSYPGSVPNTLQFLNLKSITFEECKEKHQPPAPTVVDSQICTFTKRGEGACHGDSGGPLAGNGKLVGIVSWGRPCAIGYPDVFTRVSSFAGWIEANAK